MSQELPQATCNDCIAFMPERSDDDGLRYGRCRFRAELGQIPQTFPYCDLFQVRSERDGLVATPNVKRTRSRGRSAPSRASGAAARTIASLREPTTGNTEGDINVDRNGLKQVLRELLEEEAYYGYPELAGKWDGGTVVIKPPGDQASKEIPIDVLFNKIVMVRDRLRVLEAKLNANKSLSGQEKLELQGYISKAYGSLTTFNVLFRNKSESFSSK